MSADPRDNRLVRAVETALWGEDPWGAPPDYDARARAAIAAIATELEAIGQQHDTQYGTPAGECADADGNLCPMRFWCAEGTLCDDAPGALRALASKEAAS